MSRIVSNILVVEDDNRFRDVLVSAFRERGFEAEGVADAASAIASAERDSPEMAVVDLRLPDDSGLEVVRRLKAIDPATSIVVLTGYGSIATALESVRLGATHYLTKPTDADRILILLHNEPDPDAMARAVSSNPDAYVYLAESIRAWPDQAELARRIEAAGWTDVAWRNLTGGIVALHTGVKGA